MNHYKSTPDKYSFSPRMNAVKDDILARLKPNRDREYTRTGTLAPEDKNPFLDVFMEMPDAPYVITLAHAIVRSWMVTPKIIYPNEAIVGITRPWYPIHEHFSWGIHGVDSIFEDTRFDRSEAEALAKRMEPLGKDYLLKEGEAIFGKENYALLLQDQTFRAGGYQGHTVPNYVTLLENGLDGMLALIDQYASANTVNQNTNDFYEANRIIIRGMSTWLSAYADEAGHLAESETNEIQKQYYQEIQSNCSHVAHQKPETLYQAVQLMWCLSLWDWVDCVGRTDQYLLPFYQKSISNNDVVPAEDVIVSIIFKLWEHGSHCVTLSGIVPESEADATSDLTYLMLQILRSIHDTHPRMSVRIHKNTPKELLDLILQMWSEGMSDPSIVSDETVISGLQNIGVPKLAANNYTMLGCQEIEIPGESNFGCEDGIFNLAKILEYTLYGGRSTSDPNVRIGPETPEFTEFESFEDFYDAFKIQLQFYMKHFFYLCDRGQEIRAANFSKLVKTPFTTGCLEKGKPHDAGGPIYNFGVVETAGLAPVSDSLLAIKKLVFEEKKLPAQTLIDALKANFEGYERERQLMLNYVPKFGNDDPEADDMACKVLDLFWNECGKYRSIRGDVYTGACSLLDAGISIGKAVGALPDGRFAGEPLGNSIGPRPGADKNGLSAMLASVSKLPLQKGVGGTTLNVVLTQKLLSTSALRERIAATLKAYLLNGGQMAQITTSNLEDLLDAQLHPERHGNLIVRIGGFSIQFVQLSKESQDEIISRYDGMSH